MRRLSARVVAATIALAAGVGVAPKQAVASRFAPALPFAVAPGTTAVAELALPPVFAPALVVARRGSIATTLPGERGLAPLATTALPQLLDPSAVTAVSAGKNARLPAIAVADRATDNVLILAARPDGTFAIRQTIPVGRAPAALAPTRTGVFVADAGSNDVRLLTSDDAGSYRQTQVVGVAAEPVALATGSFGATSFGEDVAVAAAGADVVTLLIRDLTGALVRRLDVPVGRRPVDVATAGPGDHDVEIDQDDGLDGRLGDDVVVVDAASADLSIVLSSAQAARAPRVRRVALPSPLSAGPVFVDVARVDRDPHQDVVVAAPGGIARFAGDGRGGMRLVERQPFGVPTGMVVDDFAGDTLPDVAAVTAATGTGALFVTLGDPLLAAAEAAENLAAGNGLLLWSERLRARRHALMRFSSGIASRVPVAASTAPIRADVGRDRRGAVVVTYARCGRTCRPYAFDPISGRERRLPLVAPVGCQVTEVAQWRARVAYVLRPTRRGGCRRDGGVWLTRRGARARRLAPRPAGLGDIDATRVAWKVEDPQTSRARVRVAGLDGPARTITRSALGGGIAQIGGPWLSGRHGYWSRIEVFDPGVTASTIARFTEVGAHRLTIAAGLFGNFDLNRVDFAVDRHSLFYSGERGVYLADAEHFTCTAAPSCG